MAFEPVVKLKNIAKHKQTVKGSLWSVSETAVYPILMLVCTPFFLTKMGVEKFGLWMLVNSIAGGLSIFSTGLSEANIRLMAKKFSEKDISGSHQIIKSSLGLCLLFSALIIFAVLLIALGLSTYNFFALDINLNALAVKALPFAGLLLAFRNLEQILLSTYKASGRYDISGKLGSSFKILILFGNLLVIYAGYDLPVMFQVSAGISFFILTYLYIRIRKENPDIDLKPDFGVKGFREILLFGSWAWLQSVFVVFASQLDKYLIGYFGGLVLLSYYSIGYLFFSQMHTLFSAAWSWVFQKVAAFKGSVTSLAHKFRNYIFASAGISFCILLGALLFGDILFGILFKPDFYKNARIYIYTFFAFESIMVMSIVPYYFLNGSGNIRLNTLLETGAKSLSIICIYLANKYYGTEGIAFGLIFSAIVFLPVQYNFTIKTLFPDKKNRYLILILVPIFYAVAGFLYGSFLWSLGIILSGICVVLLLINSKSERKFWSLDKT